LSVIETSLLINSQMIKILELSSTCNE